MDVTNRTTRSWLFACGSAGAILALLLFLELFNPWRSTLLWREVFNFGHVPLFGVIGISLLMLTRVAKGHRLSIRYQYGIALVAAVFLAALSEAVQIKGPRDADILDFLRDVAGAGSFLLIYLAEDKLVRIAAPRSLVTRNVQIIRLAGIAILVISALPLILMSTAWLNRNKAFPILFSFEHTWEETFVNTDSATTSFVMARDTVTGQSDNHVLRVDFRAVTYTGLILQDFYPDWSGLTSLSFTATSLSATPESLILRVEDVMTKPGTHDRFERVIELEPGLNKYNIPLSEVEQSRLGRQLDLRQIKRIVLFSASNPRREFSVAFDNFQLR